MDVSVVITSFNTKALLQECLEALDRSVGAAEREVFVVDNDSTDGSAELVRDRFPAVRLIENAQNLGFSKANNLALRQAGGRYVLLLNPDTQVKPDTLRRMVDVMDARPDVGVAGVKLVRPTGEIDRACRRGFPTLVNSLGRFLGLDRVFPRSRTLGGYNLGFADPDGEYEVDCVVGAFMFMRREILAEVGMLDERFFMFGEDIDWCWRIRRKNWKVLYVGNHEVMHVKGASTRQNPLEMNGHFHRAMLIFHKKHLERSYPFFVNWAVSGAIGLRWALKSLALRLRRRAG